MTKGELRKDFINRRKALSLSEVADLSLQIVQQFKQVHLTVPEILLSYSPLAETNEFNVGFCEEILLNLSPSMRIAWPKISQTSSSMEAHLVDKNKLFVKNRFNILEPLDGHVLAPESLDMVFVPLLAFDQKGYRAGYGKGFYDRYLHRCKSTVIKIGFSFFEPVDSIDDIDQFDVPLNLCITPSATYEF